MKLETQNHSQHHVHLACPRCGQNAVVQHGSVYVCLSCNFRRNVSNNDGDGAIGSMVVLTILAFIVALLMGNGTMSEAPTPDIQTGGFETVG
jgi:transposase-like protein